MQISLYGYNFDFHEAYIQGAKMIHILNQEASACTEKLLKIYSNITTLNELIDFGQIMKDKVYFDSLENLLTIFKNEYAIDYINKVSLAMECPNYWGKFETVLSEILDKYVGDNNQSAITKKLSSLDTRALASLLSDTKTQHFKEIEALDKFSSIADGASHTHGSNPINERMKIVLHDASSIQALSTAISADIINLATLFSKYIEIDLDGSSKQLLSLETFQENHKKSQMLADEIQNNKIPKEKLKPFLAQMIYLSPFEPKNYAITYYTFGDPNGELQQLAERLHVSIDFTDYRKAEENARAFFGYEYEDMENTFSGNMFYKQTKDLLGLSTLSLINECRFLFNEKLQPLLLSPVDSECKQKCDEIISLYGCFVRDEEHVLLILDNELSIFGRDGFILTNKNLYFYVGAIFSLAEISTINFSSLNIAINKQNVPMLWENLNDDDLVELHDFLFFFLKINTFIKKYELERRTHNDPTLLQMAHHDVMQYANTLLTIFNDDEIRLTVTSLSNNPYIKKKFHNAMIHYASLMEGEVPILLFDNTAFGSAKEGCLVTTKAIYIHNSFFKPQKFLLNDIVSIEINRSVPYKVFINDYELQTTLLSTNDSKVRFSSLLNRILHDFGRRKSSTTLTTYKESKMKMTHHMIENVVGIVTNEIVGQEFLKFVHAYSTSPRIQRKFANAIASYAQLDDDEIPVICFDNTLFGSAKEGCLITTTSIHIHNIMSKPEKISYSEMKSITLRDKDNLYINELELQTTNLSAHESKLIFWKLLNYIIDSLKQQKKE